MHSDIESQALLLGAAICLLVTLCGGLWWAISTTIKLRHWRKEARDARTELQELKNAESRDAAIIASLTVALEETRAARDHIYAKGNLVVAAYEALNRRLGRQQDELSRLTGQKADVEKDAEQLREDNAVFNEKIQELQSHLNSLKDQDGRIWQRPIAAPESVFRPMSERGFPIISVLNLKGGVGKTTITAHLAGSLAQKGKRALMLDLDYQRSLSMMMVPSEQRKALHVERRCLQHFLAGAQHGPSQLLACTHQVSGMKSCSIVTNSEGRAAWDWADSLEETEARLMAEWMVQPSAADIRLFLREALHAPEFTRRFDYVLCDCPPRLTTASINALAASDYVLIPVVLDALSARALPELLRFLSRMRENLLPHLSILGVVANLVTLRNDELVRQEHDLWEKLPFGLASVWDSHIPFFKTKIPDKSLFGRAAGSIDTGELKLALADVGVQKIFSQLVTEIEREIRSNARLHAATVPS